MNRHPAFGAVNAYERLKHAFGRYTKLCGVHLLHTFLLPPALEK